MWALPELGEKYLHQKTSESHRCEAEQNASKYVSGGKDPSTILDKVEGLQTECAEGGHGAQESYEEEATTGRRKHLLFLNQVDEDPHQETAENVGQKGSEREHPWDPFLDGRGQPISGKGPEESTQSN